MPTDKQLYNLYLKEMKATGLQVDKKLAAFVDSFANRVIKEPNRDIAVIYREEIKSWSIIDDVSRTIQGGMINQTAIGFGIMPEFTADIMGQNAPADLQKIFGKTKGKALSKGVFDSVEDSQKTIYNTIVKNSKLNKTWKQTSTEIRQTLKGSLKGYENLPEHIKELERVGKEMLDNTNNRVLKSKFEKQLKKSRAEIELLSDNRALKQSYKSAFNRLESAIKKNDSVLFEKAIKQATFAKNQSLAERITITEQSRVFEQSRYDERVENELVTGVEFNLSSDHDKFDECDVIANTDNGQGVGVYSLENQPAMPIHPNGVSFLIDVTIDDMSQKQADKLGYNSNKMKFTKGDKTLNPSQIKSLENMEFMQPVKVDLIALENIVKK